MEIPQQLLSWPKETQHKSYYCNLLAIANRLEQTKNTSLSSSLFYPSCPKQCRGTGNGGCGLSIMLHLRCFFMVTLLPCFIWGPSHRVPSFPNWSCMDFPQLLQNFLQHELVQWSPSFRTRLPPQRPLLQPLHCKTLPYKPSTGSNCSNRAHGKISNLTQIIWNNQEKISRSIKISKFFRKQVVLISPTSQEAVLQSVCSPSVDVWLDREIMQVAHTSDLFLITFFEGKGSLGFLSFSGYCR